MMMGIPVELEVTAVENHNEMGESSGQAMIEQDDENHNEIGENSGQAMLEQDEKVDPDSIPLAVADMTEVQADEPYVGQEFESEAAAHGFYNAYATKVGFVIRVSNLSRSRHDGSPIGRQLVCNKEGYRLHSKRDKVIRQRAETRVGCRAMINNNQLVQMFAAIVQAPKVYKPFADILSSLLVSSKLDVLKNPDSDATKLVWHLFRCIFGVVTKTPPDFERILQRHVPVIMEVCMKNATVFKGLAGCKFELLLRDLIPMLLPGLYILQTMLEGPAREDMKDLLLELCLTLSDLPGLMKPLVFCLRGSDERVNLGLRTLAFWVDTLNPDFQEPSMANVMSKVILASWSHLRPVPYPWGGKALQMLGTLGGQNGILKEPLTLECKDNLEHGLHLVLAKPHLLQGVLNLQVPVEHSKEVNDCKNLIKAMVIGIWSILAVSPCSVAAVEISFDEQQQVDGLGRKLRDSVLFMCGFLVAIFIFIVVGVFKKISSSRKALKLKKKKKKRKVEEVLEEVNPNKVEEVLEEVLEEVNPNKVEEVLEEVNPNKVEAPNLLVMDLPKKTEDRETADEDAESLIDRLREGFIDKVEGKMIKKLFLTKKEIENRNDYVLFQGFYQPQRTVTVKRYDQSTYEAVKIVNEITNHSAVDGHSSIIRCFGFEFDKSFAYLCFEPWTCTLRDLVKFSKDKVEKNRKSSRDYLETELNGKILWELVGHLSPLLQKLMRDIVSGLAHLHESKIVYRDLKPENVFVIRKGETLIAKLSNMGISKRLSNGSSFSHPGCGSLGWQAPEQLRMDDETRAVDMFNLGCVIFYTITGGMHPFGFGRDRDVNIEKNNVDLSRVRNTPEAYDLISSLLRQRPDLRPSATEVLFHPMFWNHEKRLSFLREASDRVEHYDTNILSELKKNSNDVIGRSTWDKKLDSIFIDHISREPDNEDISKRPRSYDYKSLRHLLRLIRNCVSHYRELPQSIKELVGMNPEGLDEYFAVRFPKLLMEVYRVMSLHCKEETEFKKYFQ